jgi:hypothetical protein
MFDGLMVDASHEPEAVLKVLTEATSDDGVEWTMKPHSPLTYVKPPARRELAAVGTNWKSPSLSYDSVKNDFEKTCFKINDPVGYGEESTNDQGQIELKGRSRKDFTDRFCDLWFTKIVKGEERSERFIDVWLGDPTKRRYEKIDFLPPPRHCPDTTYNTFVGFVGGDYEGEANTNIDVFLNHIKVLVGDDRAEECYEWALNHFAHMVQLPGEIPRVAAIFKSLQGLGKNLVFEKFGKRVLGKKYCLFTQDPDAILKNPGRQIDSKILVCYDEASGKDTSKYHEAIKEICTQEEIVTRQLFGNYITLQNMLRLVLFGNGEKMVKVEPSDRRLQLFEGQAGFLKSMSPAETVEYFNRFAAFWDDDANCKGVFQFLLGRDLTGWTARGSRVKTAFYDGLQSRSIGMYDEFLLDKLKRVQEAEVDSSWLSTEDRLSAGDFYGDFKVWFLKRYGQEQKPPSNKAFGGKMYNANSQVPVYEGITKAANSYLGGRKGISVYTFYYDRLLADLVGRGVVDADEEADLRAELVVFRG